MLSERLGHRLDPYFYRIFQKIFGKYGNPNLFTLLGFLAALIASFLIIKGFWFWAGLTVILSGIFDLLDGVIARKLEKVTTFGGFFDSVMDRYSDLLLLLALAIHYLNQDNSSLLILTLVVSIGTALVPYARAKAEAIQVACTIGWMERAERIILFSLGLLFNWMGSMLWILAILTHFTVLQRIYYVWKKIRNSNIEIRNKF